MLGFLSNDFGNQGGSDGTIDACINQYGITFQQFAIDHVIDKDGEQAQPVWDWMSLQPNFVAPSWNFHKYLIARDGTLVQHYGQCSYPTTCSPPQTEVIDPESSAFLNWEVVVDIQAELAKPVPRF